MLPETVMPLLGQLIKGRVVLNEQELQKAADVKYLIENGWVDKGWLVWPSCTISLKPQKYWPAWRVVTWSNLQAFWKKHFSK